MLFITFLVHTQIDAVLESSMFEQAVYLPIAKDVNLSIFAQFYYSTSSLCLVFSFDNCSAGVYISRVCVDPNEACCLSSTLGKWYRPGDSDSAYPRFVCSW